MNNPRKAALLALEKFRRSSAWIDSMTESIAKREELDPSNFSLFVYISCGTVSNLILLDSIVSDFSTKPISSIEPKILDILRISVFQLYFCDRIPQFAIVSEGVNLCKACGMGRASGFVNAVLRGIIRKGCPLPQKTGDPATDDSILYSHSKDIVDIVLALLGPVETETLLRKNNEKPDIYVQTNLQRIQPDALLEELRSSGIPAFPHDQYPNCIRIGASGSVEEMSQFQAGKLFVQDPAAYESVRIGIDLYLKRHGKAGNIKILDLCSAPGGKAMAAISILGEKCSVLACDIHENKLRRVRENAERLGFSGQITTSANDAISLKPEFINAFDIVIADVPCSGLGVIRKKPEIRYKTKDDIKSLPEKQLAILKNAAEYVCKDGLLIYSTCTITTQENEDVARALTTMLPAKMDDGASYVRFWPQRNDSDGFFAAYFYKP